MIVEVEDGSPIRLNRFDNRATCQEGKKLCL
jgi:hypothetical protein